MPFIKKIIFFLPICLLAAQAFSEAKPSKTVIANKAVVLRGIAFERYQLPKLLKALKIKDVKTYSIANGAPALMPFNKFRLDKLPRIFVKQSPKYIIMVDFPLNKGVMPKIVLKSIIRDVKRGSTLVILGGLFTLNKGEFSNIPLAPLLPVKVSDIWAVKQLKIPLKTPGGTVAYIHHIPLTAGAKTLFAVKKKTLWVSKKYGNGRIIVFLGIPSGVSKSDIPLFWKNKKWTEFAVKIIRKELK
jgi:hypothetical protein